jgi:hypothetical protein
MCHGRDNIDVSQSLNNLAMVYQNQGRYGDAEPLCRALSRQPGRNRRAPKKILTPSTHFVFFLEQCVLTTPLPALFRKLFFQFGETGHIASLH